MNKNIWYLTVALAYWLPCLLTTHSAKSSVNANDDVFAPQRQSTERSKARKHHQHSSSSSSKLRKPNIILFLTDDQDVELGSLNYMPRTLKLIRDQGAELRHAYTTTPMCCPSRSSLLTGLYMHNHHVYTNNDNCSSPQWQATHETRSFATYLSNAGYRTGYFGKYLNKYNGSYIPPGWREWGGLIMNSRYYNYSINLNGKKVKHGDDYEKDYYPDLIVNDSISFLRQSKQYFSRKPVMLVLSFPAPHGPEDSAPQYSNSFFNVTSHHTPSYDYAPNSDKQWILQVTGKMQPIHRQFTDLLMTKRLQTLQSVDVAVERVVQELKTLGELDNTYIIYTSDHGYHLGQFGLVKGKSFPFEFDVRVPFLVRGPGIEAGSTVENVVLNIDLAPTFLDIAGVEPPSHMDGRSFFKLLFRKKKIKEALQWPDTFLIESSGRRETAEMIAESKLQESLSLIEKSLNQTLVQSTGEAGDSQLDNQVSLVVPGSKLERLALECQKPEFQAPCKPGQKWQCIADGNRWRKHKCKFQTNVLRKPRKCACFTPNGVMYTKLETDDHRVHRHFIRGSEKDEFQLKDISSRASRMARKVRQYNEENDAAEREDSFKQDMEMWLEQDKEKNRFGEWLRRLDSVDSVREWASRAKRETKQRLNTGVLQEILNIKEKILSLEDPVNGTDTVGEWNCTVGEGEGEGISCSDAIYNSPESWRATQQRLEQEIRKLKAQLDKLKEIKRFLKEKKPYDRSLEETDEDIEEEEDDDSDDEGDLFEDIFDEQITTTEKDVIKPKKKKKIPISFDHEPTVVEEDSLKHNMSVYNESEINVNRIIKKRKQRPNSETNEGNYRHRHRHKGATNTSDEVVTSINPPNLLNTTLPRKDWPGPGPGRIDVTILEPVSSQTTQSKRPAQLFPPDTCYCDPYLLSHKDEKDVAREARRKLKEERLKRKERKMRRKAKLESECLAEKMNCFNHDNQHWRTPPLWTEGPFCFCMNANNNTYYCLRTINKTHNYLYCEFVTGLITYYNLRLDPFEQWNRAALLTTEEKSYLHDTLSHLKGCRGARQCTISPPRKHRKHRPNLDIGDREPSKTS